MKLCRFIYCAVSYFILFIHIFRESINFVAKYVEIKKIGRVLKKCTARLLVNSL